MGGSIASLLPDFIDKYRIYFFSDGTPKHITNELGKIVAVYIDSKIFVLPIIRIR